MLSGIILVKNCGRYTNGQRMQTKMVRIRLVSTMSTIWSLVATL